MDGESALPRAQVATQFPAFRLKVILNTVIVASTAILLQQFLMDQADSMAYMTFDFTGFLGRIGNLFLYAVIPPAIVGTLIAYLYVTPLHRLLRTLHAGGQPTEAARRRAMRILASYPYVLIALNMVGFGVGVVLGTPANQLFTSQGLVIDFQNIIGGAVFANVQISINQLILAKPRALLRYHHMDSDAHEPGIALRNMFVTLPLAIYAMLTLIAVGQSIGKADELYTSVYYSVATREKSLAEATATYQDAVGSARQLPPREIKLPPYQAKMREDFLGVIVGLFLFLCALAFLSQLFSSRVQVRQLGALTGRLREITTGKVDRSRRAIVGGFGDFGELSDAINLFVTKLRDLFAQFVESGQQVTRSSAVLRGYLATVAASTKEMVASIGQIAANVGDNSALVKRSTESLTASLDSLEGISRALASQTTLAEETSSAASRMATNTDEISAELKQLAALIEAAGRSSGLTPQSLTAIGRSLVDPNALVQEIVAGMERGSEGTKEMARSMGTVTDSVQEIRRMAEEQKEGSASIRRTIDSLVWIFSRVQEATEEQSRTNQEIIEAAANLQSVAHRNQMLVDRLRELLGSFVMDGAEIEDGSGRG